MKLSSVFFIVDKFGLKYLWRWEEKRVSFIFHWAFCIILFPWANGSPNNLVILRRYMNMDAYYKYNTFKNKLRYAWILLYS